MLSVIIPAYNCIEVLKYNVLALINQNIKEEYEVLVCDDGSPTSVEDEMIKLKVNFCLPFELKCFYQKKDGFGAGRARNLGVKHAKGNKLLFLDQDVIVSPGHIDLLLNVLQPRTFQTGIKKLVPLEFYKKYITDDKVILNNFSVFDKEHFGQIKATLSSFGVIYKSDFESVCGFDEDFKEWGLEDTELIDRLKDVGIKGFFLKTAISYHIHHEGHNIQTLTRKAQNIYHHKRNHKTGDGKFVSIN